MSYQFAPTNAPVRKVTKVEFGILSPEEIIKQSVVKVEHEVLYENKEPKVGSLSDVRMGCIDKNMECYTCKETINNCPGHFGHIELNVAVYHIQFIKVVKKILECVCHKCARFRLLPSDDRFKKLMHVKEKFKYACENAKIKKVCEHSDCEEKLLPLRRTNGNYLYYDNKKFDKKMGRIPLIADDARNILERITDEICRFIGLDPEKARPEWMIITVLPVPPPCVRPSITVDTNGRSEDDLTHMLTNIIKYNNLVKRHENSRSAADFKEQLQVHVTTYIDNDISGIDPVLQKGGRPIKSMSARLKGKDGLIRGNLMGKRVDFSARTVITGDPNISIEEVGVPYSIAKNLTFPETVSIYNREVLQKLVDNSPNYPGAKFVIREDGSRVDLQYCARKPVLRVGDKIERHMQNGDIVLFNRQPTLHKPSMMGHRAKVMTGSTFRLNVNICSSYNADFDGDEMNLHMPQSYETQAELSTLSRVSQLLISAQANKPVNALVQDALCGIRQLTSRDTFLTRAQMENLVMWLKKTPSEADDLAKREKYAQNKTEGSMLSQKIYTLDPSVCTEKENCPHCTASGIRVIDGKGPVSFSGEEEQNEKRGNYPRLPTPAIVKPIPLWTGKQLLSLMLPCIDLYGFHSVHSSRLDHFKKNFHPTPKEVQRWIDENPEDTRVIIADGELLSGIICKRTAGSAAGSIIHVIFNDYGSDAARDFMDNASQIIVQWMLMEGFSVGLGDAVISRSATSAIKDIVDEQYKKADVVISMYRSGSLLAQGNMSAEETKENKLQEILAKARDAAGALAGTSLNKKNNIKQMVEAGSKGSILNICQISAAVGQQIVDGKRIPYGYHKRTLPHYEKLEDSPESRGFVRNAFISGLMAQEVFFHAMGGREGLIDTSVKTSETGYIQRRLVKALEDYCVKYDGTVRNSKGEVVQFYYGEDGFDGCAVESQTLETLLMPNDEFHKKFFVPELEETEWKQLSLDRQFLRENLRIQEDKWALPLNIKRIITRGQTLFRSGQPIPSYSYVYETVMDLRKSLEPSKIDLLERPDDKYLHPSTLFGILLSSALSSKKVINFYKLTKDAFDWIIGDIRNRYHKGLISPGESVGIVAAQSIGEPATQMTLNVFHLSGTGNKAVTSGIPRLKELINAVKNLKTPGMTVYLNENVRTDAQQVRKIKARIEHCTLSMLVEKQEILHDPDYTNSLITADSPWMNTVVSIPDDDLPKANMLYSWTMRLTLSRSAMIERNLSVIDIVDKIMVPFDDELFILHSDDNSEEIVLQLRWYKEQEDIDNKDDAASGQENSFQFLEHIKWDFLSSLTISGVPGIDKAFISQKPIVEYDENGALSSKRREFVIETDGINLRDVVKVPGIDLSRLYCNDPQEMMSMFGVEVARETLMEEIRSVIESGGSYINYRHLCLLCEVMTNRGQIMSITRHGINKTDAGPLTKCTFEQTVDILMDAAVFGESDHIRGVAENIIMGQIAPIGTGMMDVISKDVELNLQDSDGYEMFDGYEEYERGNEGAATYLKRATLVERDVDDEYCPLRPSYLKN